MGRGNAGSQPSEPEKSASTACLSRPEGSKGHLPVKLERKRTVLMREGKRGRQANHLLPHEGGVLVRQLRHNRLVPHPGVWLQGRRAGRRSLAWRAGYLLLPYCPRSGAIANCRTLCPGAAPGAAVWEQRTGELAAHVT